MVAVVIICVIVIIAVALLGKYIAGRRADRRDDAWEGVVVSKDHSSPDGQNMYHSVTVKLANGTTKEVRIPGSLWKTLNEGDKVQKRAGNYDPAKVE